MSDMKVVRFGPRSKARVLHIEVDGCIVNIRRGLRDMEGRAVTSVQVIPDGPDGMGSGGWELPDEPNDATATGVRVREIQR